MKTFKCVVVDDDEIDILMVVSCIKRFPKLILTGSFESAEDALKNTNLNEVDVLFLDVDMPGMSGIGLREMANQVPACIFITSYPQYALDSFSVETLDFIVKPLKYERFAQAVGKIEQFMDMREKASLYENHIGGDYVHIKEGHNETKVNMYNIIYLEALKDYTLIITAERKHCVLTSIGNLLKEENFSQFVRIHRSFAVRKDFVKSKSTNSITLNNDVVLPVGRSFKENLLLL